MSRVRAWLRCLAVAFATTFAGAAMAGQACDSTPPDIVGVSRSLALAQRVQQSLDDSGARVVIIARAGQDLTRYGLNWSHLAFAYRLESPTPAWRVAHKLNQCGTAEAAIYRQGLAEFFLDTPLRYEAAYVVPAPEVQAALMQVLTDDQRLVQWHTRAYSVVAYPWATRYQQSNQWALETLAGSLDPAASTRERAQAWLQLHDYRPTVLHLDALTRLGGRMTRANVAYDDHPNAKRFSDHIETVTVESMFAWMQRDGIAGSTIVVR